MAYAWSVAAHLIKIPSEPGSGPAEILGLETVFYQQLFACALLLRPHLWLHKLDSVNWGDNEHPRNGPCYQVQVRGDFSFLKDGAFFGLGAARETLAGAINSFYCQLLTFQGCGVFLPVRGVQLAGPAERELRQRAHLVGIVPGNWPLEDSELMCGASGFFSRESVEGRSLEADIALRKLGHGMRLARYRSPFISGVKGTPDRVYALIPDRRICTWPTEDLPTSVAEELLAMKIFVEQDRKRQGNRAGWEESGLPGDEFVIWCFAQ
jgi:hypothetical protein